MTERHVIETVTPELATEWLRSNTFARQRPLREHHVITLAEEMERGTYIAHSAIVFAELEGEKYIIDGQHRLNAIALSGIAVQTPVLTKIARTAAEVQEWYGNIDQGLRRSTRDAIKARQLHSDIGISERAAGRLSAAVKVVASGFQDGGGGFGLKSGGRSNAAISDLMTAWSQEARAYLDAISGGERSNAYLLERAPVLACGLLTFRFRPAEALSFWTGVSQDDGLKKDDPRKRFLLWLQQPSKSTSIRTARAFSVAWRAHTEDRAIQFIRFDDAAPLKLSGVPFEQCISSVNLGAERVQKWRDDQRAAI